MWRASKMSFWVLRPSEQNEKLHIELPLLASPRNPLKGPHGNQIRCINSDYQPRKRLSRWEKVLRKYGEIMDGLDALIGAQSNGLLAWNLMMFLLVYFSFIEIPIALMVVGSFAEAYQQYSVSLAYCLELVLLLTDMLLVRPRIAYQIKGRTMAKSEETFKYYMQNYLAMDLLGVFVLGLSFIPVKNIDFLRLLFLLKVIPLMEINRQIKGKLVTFKFSAALYDFIKLVLFIVFVTNLYACIYFAIDKYYYDQQGDFYQQGFLWLNGSYALGNLDIFQTYGDRKSYIYALFWALQTARTCGYGVATPKNYVQILYVNFVMLTIVVIFVYFTNGVVKLILAHSEHRREKLNNIKRAIDVAQQFELKAEMKDKLVEFITDLDDPQEELQECMEGMLSNVLRDQFRLAFRNHFLNLVSLVSLVSGDRGEAQLFRIELAKTIKRRHYQAGDLIFQSKKMAQGRLLLIERGVCTVQNVSVGYRKLQSEWAIIGRREFYFQTMPIFSAVANEYLSCLEMRRCDFLVCLKKYQIIYEKYCEIMEAVLISQRETDHLHIKCIFCNQYHMHQQCPLANNWRNQLRIKNTSRSHQEETHSNQRQIHKRGSISSQKILHFRVESVSIDLVTRTAYYFHHYNL